MGIIFGPYMYDKNYRIFTKHPYQSPFTNIPWHRQKIHQFALRSRVSQQAKPVTIHPFAPWLSDLQQTREGAFENQTKQKRGDASTTLY